MKIRLHVAGMHCAACTQRLGDAFRSIPGVRSALLTLEPPRAEIDSDQPIPLSALQEAARAAGNYTVSQEALPPAVSPSKPSLFPLYLVLGFVGVITMFLHLARGAPNLTSLLHDFMGVFFLFFAFFKLLDLRGFAQAYSSYDLLASRSRAWAFAYPFVEFGLGVTYLLRWQLVAVNVATLVLMLLGGLGVARALARRETIRCACLGTALQLPMTTVTLVENFGMAAMAAAMLFLA